MQDDLKKVLSHVLDTEQGSFQEWVEDEDLDYDEELGRSDHVYAAAVRACKQSYPELLDREVGV